jgi:hypothetical protein
MSNNREAEGHPGGFFWGEAIGIDIMGCSFLSRKIWFNKCPRLAVFNFFWLAGMVQQVLFKGNYVSAHAVTPATPLGRLRSWCGCPGEILRSTALPTCD